MDFLSSRKLKYVDLLESQIQDLRRQKRDIKDYLREHYISHFSPLGNFFAAHKIRASLVGMMNPKPPAYRSTGGTACS